MFRFIKGYSAGVGTVFTLLNLIIFIFVLNILTDNRHITFMSTGENCGVMVGDSDQLEALAALTEVK